MRKATLNRSETGADGTFGLISTDSGLQLYSLELPWKDNLTGKSCIPAGVYKCAFGLSPKHGPCYYVLEVPGRSDIEIHAANWAGDKDAGKYAQLEGCIAPGRSVQTFSPGAGIRPQKGVTSSRDALQSLEEDLDREPFMLEVAWMPGVGPHVTEA